MPINEFYEAPRFTPLDPNSMLSIQKYKDEKVNQNLDFLKDAASSLPIKGGYATQNLAKRYNEEKITPLLANYADRIAKNESPSTWYRDYIKDVNSIKSDPIYNKIKEDEGYTSQVGKQMGEPDFDFTLQDYYDPKGGFAQVGVEDIASGWSPGRHYSGEKPLTVNTDFKDVYDQFRADLKKEFDAPVKSFTYDDKGNPIAVVETTTGTQVKYIDRDKIRKMIAPMVYGNFQGLMGSKQSLRYNAKYYNRQNPNYQYTPEQAVEDITNGFLGSFREEQEMQPRTASTTFPKGTKGKGLDSYADLLPNPVDDSIRDAQVNPEGTANLNVRTAAALLNGSAPDEKAGNFQLNLSGSPTLLSVGDASGIPQTGQDNSIKLNVYGRMKDLLSQEEDLVSNKYDLRDIPENKAKELFPEYFTPEAKAAGWIYDISLSGHAAFKQIGEQEGMFGTVSNAVLNRIPVTHKAIAEKTISDNPKFKNLKDKYLSEYGIDISDPKFKDEILTMGQSEENDLLGQLAVGLENSKATVTFIPNSTNGLFRGNDGNFWVQGTAELPTTEVKALFGEDADDKIEKALEQGIIQPRNTNESGDVTSYTVTINKPVYEDQPGATQRYWSGYGTETKEFEQANLQIKRSREEAARNKSTAEAIKFLRPMVSRDPEGFTNNLIAKVNSSDLTSEQKSQINRGLNQLMSTIKAAQVSGNHRLMVESYTKLYQFYASINSGAKSPTPETKAGSTTVGAKSYQPQR